MIICNKLKVSLKILLRGVTLDRTFMFKTYLAALLFINIYSQYLTLITKQDNLHFSTHTFPGSASYMTEEIVLVLDLFLRLSWQLSQAVVVICCGVVTVTASLLDKHLLTTQNLLYLEHRLENKMSSS